MIGRYFPLRHEPHYVILNHFRERCGPLYAVQPYFQVRHGLVQHLKREFWFRRGLAQHLKREFGAKKARSYVICRWISGNILVGTNPRPASRLPQFASFIHNRSAAKMANGKDHRGHRVKKDLGLLSLLDSRLTQKAALKRT